MWTLTNLVVENNTTPTASSGEGAPLAIVTNPALEPTPTTGTVIDPTINSTITTNSTPITTNLPVVANTSNTSGVNSYSITNGTGFPVTTVSSNGTTFTPAINPSNPQNGEFVSYGENLVLYSNTPLISALVTSTSGDVIPTTKVENLPALISNLPLQGQLSISRGFQEHPSGSLILIGDYNNIKQIRKVFRQGTEFDLFGIGFVIKGYSEQFEQNCPGGLVGVSVSLGGKWEKYLTKPVKFKDSPNSTDIPFTDPDCDLPSNTNNSTSANSISALASKAGITYSGPGFSVAAPQDADINASTTVGAELDSTLPIKQNFLFLSDNNSVTAKTLNTVTTWNYNENQILSTLSNSYNRFPSDKYTPDFTQVPIKQINLLAEVPATITLPPTFTLSSEDTTVVALPEYRNVLLTGNFSEDENNDNNNNNNAPNYEIVAAPTRTYYAGDPEPLLPPVNIQILRTLDLNFDKSGPTKTAKYITSQGSTTTFEFVQRYGFAYLAIDIYTVAGGQGTLQAPAFQFWKCIEEYTIEYLYDENTGYFIGTNTIGKRLLRHNPNETNDNLVTLELGDSYGNPPSPSANDGSGGYAEYNSYLFKWVPLISKSRNLLKQHRDFYKTFEDSTPAFEIYKHCFPNGTSALAYKLNPNFAESMFVAAESLETICYSEIPNPQKENNSTGPEAYPTLTTGEDTRIRKFVEIQPSENTKSTAIATPLGSLNPEDTYVEYSSTFSAQDPGFTASAENTNTSINSGIPPQALRRQPKYAKEETTDSINSNSNTTQYKHIVYTPGVSSTEPEQGSLSFANAKTVGEAVTGAKFLLKIQDIRESVTTSFTVPLNLTIKEGDIVQFQLGGIQYRRRVLKIDHQFTFHGLDETGKPLTTSPGTNLTLGIERDVIVNYKKEQDKKTPLFDSNLTINLPSSTNGFVLGEILPLTAVGRGHA